MLRTKTVALFEDLSGIGRCALSVAIPIISAMGCQACPVPTALLSAHTAFGGVVPMDMTSFAAEAISEWENMGRVFDCTLSGYMPSSKCVDAVAPFIARQKGLGHTTIIDPAMADDGKLYRSLDVGIIASYKNACRHASLITPNETEARLLAGRGDALNEVMDALLELDCDGVIITGWPLGGSRCANAYKARGGDIRLVEYELLNARFPGTGDILAACLAGYVCSGLDAFSALERATAFVRRAMETTIAAGTEPREGVLFERELGFL